MKSFFIKKTFSWQFILKRYLVGNFIFLASMNTHKPWRRIRYFAYSIDLIAWILLIPWLINFYRFLHDKQTFWYYLFNLRFRNTKKEQEMTIWQVLIRIFTHLPFFVVFFEILYGFFFLLLLLGRFILVNEMITSVAIFRCMLFVLVLLSLTVFSLVSSLFIPTLSERWSKTETIYNNRIHQ